jgi:hypothetical protein
VTTRHKVLIGAVSSVLIVAGTAGVGAVDRQHRGGVRICHQQPDQPGTFHEIKVGRNVIETHLAHGDWLGPCGATQSTVAGLGTCDPPCDDGNACTLDICDMLCTTPSCTTSVSFCRLQHPPVDCDDGDPCTRDGCHEILGCVNTPIVCNDGDQCTVDVCEQGECLHPELECPGEESCEPSTGECLDACDGVDCRPAGVCIEPGSCVVVDGQPECVDGLPLPDDTVCDDDDNNTIHDSCLDGECGGTLASCPCWDGDLRVPEGLGPFDGLSLTLDPEPLCGMEPPPTVLWDVVCREALTFVTYVHEEICPEFEAYDSLIRLTYQTSDGGMGRQCEASITDAGYYSMFQLRARVDNLSLVEFDDCQALLRQEFPCPDGR